MEKNNTGKIFNLNKKNIIVLVFFVMTLGIYFSFGVLHLGKFVTVDERRWVYNRVPNYWKGILSQKWKKTYVHPKPGITVTLISGASLLEYKNPEKFVSNNRPEITGETQSVERFYTASRLPIVLFNGLFAVFFFWIIKKITDKKWTAIWSTILILLSPILIGMSQIVNADSLVWTFSTATILFFIGYLKTEEKKLAVLTSLFLGLALLSKFIAVILFPFLFIIYCVHGLLESEKWKENEKLASRKILEISLAYFLIVIGSLGVFAILLPASFIKFKYLYEGTIGYPGMGKILWPIFSINFLLIFEHFVFKNKFSIKALNWFGKIWKNYSNIFYGLLFLVFITILFNYLFRLDFLKLEAVPFDSYQKAIFYENSWLKKMLLEFRPLVFSITPLVLISVLYLWFKLFFKKIKDDLLVFSLSFFIIIFCAAVIQEKLLNIVRYSIVLYPLLAILAALGLQDLFTRKKWSRIWITVSIMIICFVSLWGTKPFYLNYSSFFLPKNYIISDAWGYGGYEAAQYLNSLPGAENLSVWSDNSGVCEFFKGKCIKSSPVTRCKFPKGYDHFDYLVFSRRGEILFLDLMQIGCINTEAYQKIIDLYHDKEAKPLFELDINGRPSNFIQVFKATN